MRLRAKPERRRTERAAGVAAGGLLAAALSLAWVGATAPYEVQGLRLGDSREAVLSAHPDLRLRAVPYEDPWVGTDYALTYGRVAVLRYEGKKLEQTGEREGYDLAVRLTGDGRLYEADAKVFDPARPCDRAIEDTARRYGPPDIDERPSYAMWRDPTLLGPRLEIRCLGEGLHRVRVADPSLAEAYEERLKDELQDAVREALQVVR